MAIVDMKKISIIGLSDDKDAILRLLMKRGFVQIDDGEACLLDPIKPYLEKDSADALVMELEQKLFQTEQAISLLAEVCKIKKPMLSLKDDYQPLKVSEVEALYQKAVAINALKKQIDTDKQEILSLTNNKSLLMPWTAFDIPLGSLETRFTKTVLGTMPLAASVPEIREKLLEEGFAALVGEVQSDRLFRYVYLISHKADFDSATDLMKESGFLAVAFHDETQTVSDAVRTYQDAIQKKEDAVKQAEQQFAQYRDSYDGLKNLYDYYCIEKEGKAVRSKLLKTKATFFLTGWLPAEKADAMQKELMAFDCSVETAAPEKGEGFPILLHNNRIVTPFESITSMYSCPGPNDVDPNPIMAFFFIVFFGMMLSDAAYGIIIAAACGFLVYKLKLQKGEGNLIKLIGLGGVSTAIWGLVFGSAFGDLIKITPLINPLEDVMLLMGLSFVMGMIHIYVGLGMKGYMLIRDGKAFDAFCDVFLWYLFVTGVCLLIVPVVAGDIGIFAEIGKYLAIIGCIGLILTQGRVQKNLFMKLFKGVSSLYDITAYFSDILSYSRLMALCLTTGVISQVINLLGAIAGPVPAFIIGLVGHTVNLLINALGAYVHTSRLQYVEFFSKFYEGGGIPFTPFKYKTKYTNIKKEEM